MNIFIIHSGTDIENVIEKKSQINKINDNGKKKASVLLLKYRKFWKHEAKKLIKSAQVVLYILSEDGHKSKNIDWEINQAKKQQKAIVILNEGKKFKLNESLREKDAFTKEVGTIGKEIASVEELYEIIDNYENDEYIHLFNDDNVDPEKLFEQYKLFSDTSESLVTRRQNVNSFYITANTALFTVAVTVFSLNANLISQIIITMVLSIPGILLNGSWLKVMESYSLINSSKMKIISRIEKQLPASLYDAEWAALSDKLNKRKYVSFTNSEKRIPRLFIIVYICIAVFSIVLLFQ